jgi:hypothetical protein
VVLTSELANIPDITDFTGNDLFSQDQRESAPSRKQALS